ncbi:dephospho-CoA kinase [Rhodovibrionaceae bacterium A322]
MFVLGLTGSIGMGKSTAASLFRSQGVPVHDSDAAVHKLLAKGGAAVPEIARLFPDAVVDGAVDRQILGARVFGDGDALKQLEAIVHPLVRQSTRRFLQKEQRNGRPLVVLDIPLLFESKAGSPCDAVVVVSAPAWLQRQRVLRRPGMTPEKLSAILAKQMPDLEKRLRAQFVVLSGLGKHYTLRQIQKIISQYSG